MFGSFKAVDSIDHGIRVLSLKEDPGVKPLMGVTYSNSLQCTAMTVGNDWAAEGLGFNRDDPEVLVSGEQEGAAVCVQFEKLFVPHPAEEIYCRSCYGFQLSFFTPCSGYQKRASHPVACVDQNIDAFRCLEAAD